MKSPTLCLMAMILLARPATDASAQVTNLISLRNLQQSAQLSYRFDANQGALASTAQHGLQEDYHFGIDYVIYKARLLRGQASLGLQGDQQKFSGEAQSSGITKSVGLLYDISGVFLDRFPYPVTFYLASGITDVPREFASSYQQKSDTVGVSVSVANKHLPVSFNYTRASSYTSGLENDRIQSSDTFAFGGAHNYKMISLTQFALFRTSQVGGIKGGSILQDSESVEATLNNTLTLGGKELDRILYSRWRFSGLTGVNESRSAELGEYLVWDFGKVLTANLDYSLSHRDAYQQGNLLNVAKFSLQHRLFDSLTTQFGLSGSHNTRDSGTEQSASGILSLSYQKLLPAESVFHLQGYQQYGVTSNKLTDDRLPVIDEPHTVSASEQLLLNNPDVVPGSVVVHNADSTARALPYLENQDYQIRQFGGKTEIFVPITGSEINAGDNLVITYQYFVNTRITYSSSSQGVSGDFVLFESRYRLSAGWDRSRQELVSGEADQVNLSGVYSVNAGLERRFDSSTLSARYDMTSSQMDKTQTVGASYRYSGQLGQGRVSFTANERYMQSEQNALVNKSGSRRNMNIFGVGGSYNRTLESAALLTATANFLDSRGSVASQNLSLGVGLQWNIRRTTLNVRTQANFHRASGTLTTDQHLQVRVSRFF